MKTAIQILLTGIILTFSLSAQITSGLWGEDGELWDPGNSILRDFSTVGYMNGDVPIPDWPVGVNVLDFGAVPNDVTVCNAQAFRDAIAACPNYHAVLVPKGRYTIMEQIKPLRDHFVLRGEDMYESVLFFPKYLNEIYIQEVGFEFDNTSLGLMEGFITMSGGTEKSIENLSFEFREQRKGGLWEHLGVRAIEYEGDVTHSWIRNVYIKNYDYGIGINGASNLSVINVTLDGFIGRQSIVGSGNTPSFDALMGIMVYTSDYNLYHNVDVKRNVMHPIDMNNWPGPNVFSKIRGVLRAISWHGGGSSGSLYTDLNNYVSGDKGHKNRTYETFWGVDYALPMGDYNSTNNHIFVGYGSDWVAKSTDTVWYEPAAYGHLTPGNLYLAQLEYFGKPLPENPPPPIPSPYEGDVFRIAPTDSKHTTRDALAHDGSYFKFDLSEIDVASVAHARFRVTFKGISNAPYRLGAWSVSDDSWSEETLTSENAPELISELDTVWIEADRENMTVEFDVTAFVRGQLVGGDGVVSLGTRRTEGNGFNSNFFSRKDGQGPELIVERVASSVPGAPSAPKGIRSTALVGNIILDWDDNPEPDVATYTVYRNRVNPSTGEYSGYGHSHAAGLTSSDFVNTSTEDWRIGMMDNRYVYKYKITAVDAHGYESERSQEFVAAVLHPTNAPPAFNATTSLANAIVNVDYSANLATEASDPESDPMYFMKVSGPDWLQVALDGTLSGAPGFSDTGPNTFTFQVTAIGGSAQTVATITVVTPPDDPPGAPAVPTGLSATIDNNSVSLTWNANTEADLAGYHIYRSTTSGVFGAALATYEGTNTYVDSTVTNGTTYYYAVTAIDSNNNESDGSSEVSATPFDMPPGAPTGLTAEARNGSVRLEWADNVEGDLVGYNIYRSTSSGSYAGALVTNLVGNTYSDLTASNGTTFYYVVTAVDQGGNESAQSAEVSATPDEGLITYTTFIGSATDDIWDAANWDNGLPDRLGSLGTINSNARWNSAVSTLTDYHLNIIGGTLSTDGFANPWIFDGGEQTFNGGSFFPDNSKTLEVSNGAVFTVNHANSAISWDNLFTLKNASFIMNAGTMSHATFRIWNGGIYTLNGGTVTVANDFGVSGFGGGGSVFLNGGTLSAGTLRSDNSRGLLSVTLGGTTSGSVTFGSFVDSNYSIDWLAGTKMSMTITGVVGWAKSEWDAGRMTYNGQDYTALGDWATVTSTGFGDGDAFAYDSATNTLSLALPVVDAGPDQTVEISDSAPWTPLDIQGLSVWYDASDASTITASGGAVSQWADKSGNGNHAVQETAGKQPSWSSDSMNFDGGDILRVTTDAFNGMQNPSVIAVTRRDVSTGWGNSIASWRGENENGWNLRQRGGTATRYAFTIRSTSGVDDVVSGSMSALGVTHMIAAYRMNAATRVARMNGTETLRIEDTGTINYDVGYSAIGGRFNNSTATNDSAYLTGAIYELIALDGISEEDAEKLEGYLAHKWGLAGHLPEAHPYKAAPPGGGGARAELDGTVSVAGGNPLTTTWTLQSGPAADNFADASAVDTTVTFSEPGTYVLRLTAGDGAFQSYDEVTVTVTEVISGFTVAYEGNGNTGGEVPVDGHSPYAVDATVTVLGNTGSLTRTDHTFAGWNTAPDRSGITYAPGSTFTPAEATILYALWLTDYEAWEFDNFGSIGVIDGSDDSGVPYYFMYLHGTDPSDPSDRFRVSIEPNQGGAGMVFGWEVLERFELGVHYDVHISTNLIQWDPIPAEHYSVQQTPIGDRTRIELTLTHDYGTRAFIRIVRP